MIKMMISNLPKDGASIGKGMEGIQIGGAIDDILVKGIEGMEGIVLLLITVALSAVSVLTVLLSLFLDPKGSNDFGVKFVILLGIGGIFILLLVME